MSKNLRSIPYTELQERLIEIARVPENAKPKARGVLQDVYIREISNKWDWDFLLASSSIITEKQHTTGTLSVNTGDTSVTFSSDAAVTADMAGRNIKIGGNDVVYTLVDSTGAIRPSFQGSTNASNQTYTIFKSRYSLASSFDRFPKSSGDEGRNGGLYKWQGGRKLAIPKESYQESTELFQSTPSTPTKFRLVEPDTAGNVQIEFRPPPKESRVYGYDYLTQVEPMTETSAGVVTVTAKGTTVTGSTACRFTEANTGDYLRISDFGAKEDSTWHKIIAIVHDSSLTLQSAFQNSGATDASYVISSAPQLPAKLHLAVLFGSVRAMTLDQTDENFIFYNMKMAEVMTDAKTLFVSRIYSQEFKTIASEEFTYRR